MSTFQFPEWKRLSRDEQMPITNLPIKKSYFVQGGPGTGKSILAVHRVAKIKDIDPDKKVKLLVYNKPLQLHLESALEASGLDAKVAQTCHSWIWEMTGLPLPKTLWGYDWPEVSKQILGKTKDGKIFDHLILDEAQDIPVPLLEILSKISVTATIFADNKQAINPETEHPSADDIIPSIVQCFDLGPGCIFYLSKNFRNTQRILDAAHAIKPLLDDELSDQALRSDGPRPNLRQASVDALISRIETYHSNNPAATIAVAVHHSWGNRVKKKLETSEVPTQIYTNADAHNGKYSPNFIGATVIPYDITKGLEFEAVFMAFLNEPYLHGENTEEELIRNQNIVYVVSTRARNHLEYSYVGEMPPSWLTSRLDKACESNLIQRV